MGVRSKTLLNPRTRLPGLTKEAAGEIRNFVVCVRVLEGVCLIQHISTDLFAGQLRMSDSSDSPDSKMDSGRWRSIKCRNCPRHLVQDVNCRKSCPFPLSGASQGLANRGPSPFRRQFPERRVKRPRLASPPAIFSPAKEVHSGF
jgi:hypothetical protein